jgi:hypothetical protein
MRTRRDRDRARSVGKRPPDPETQVAAPGDGGVPVAVGRTEELRIDVPGTAADDTGLAIASCPRRAIRGRPNVVSVIAILHPLPHIAQHVIDAERIGLERADRRGLSRVPLYRAPAAPSRRLRLLRGITTFPSVGDAVLLPSSEQLRAIVEASGTDTRVSIQKISPCPKITLSGLPSPHSGNQLSSTWRVWSDKNDVYLATRSLSSVFKTSLHASVSAWALMQI